MDVLIYGVVTIVVGISLIWWLPDRPIPVFNNNDDDSNNNNNNKRSKASKFLDSLTVRQRPILTEAEQALHQADMKGRYLNVSWTLKDLWKVLLISVFGHWLLCILELWVLVMGLLFLVQLF